MENNDEMVKYGHVYVNKNISKSVLLLIIVFCFTLFIVMAKDFITNIIKTQNYIEIDGIITNIYSVENSEDSRPDYFISFKYLYEGIEYNNDMQILIIKNKKIGNNIKVYINPENPIEFKDSYMINSALLFSIICFGVLIFLIYIYFIRRKTDKKETFIENKESLKFFKTLVIIISLFLLFLFILLI